MAGGLGTRMRSAVPKHLHPILGRRMVDWVLEAARPLGPAPLVVIASPESRDAFGDVQVAVQEQRARNRRRRPLARARPSASGAESLLVLSGDTPLLTTELLAGARRDAPARAGGGDRALVRARGRSARTAGSSGPPTAPSRRSSRRATRRRSSSRSASATPRSTSSAPTLLWPALDRLEPHNAQGELYLTDAVRDLVEPRRARRRARRRRRRPRPRA